MAAILAQMRGDAVGTGLDRHERGAHRVRPRASPRVTQCCDVIDVDAEAQRWSFGHLRTRSKFCWTILILRSAKRVSKDEGRQSGRMVPDGASRLLTMRVTGGT
jgi:hypothetical protein